MLDEDSVDLRILPFRVETIHQPVETSKYTIKFTFRYATLLLPIRSSDTRIMEKLCIKL